MNLKESLRKNRRLKIGLAFTVMFFVVLATYLVIHYINLNNFYWSPPSHNPAALYPFSYSSSKCNSTGFYLLIGASFASNQVNVEKFGTGILSATGLNQTGNYTPAFSGTDVLIVNDSSSRTLIFKNDVCNGTLGSPYSVTFQINYSLGGNTKYSTVTGTTSSAVGASAFS